MALHEPRSRTASEPRRSARLAFFAAAALGVWLSCAGTSAATAGEAWPGAQWERGDCAQPGLSPADLEGLRSFVATLPPSSGVVICDGREVFAWGDPARRIKISSMRKSLLSALYGIYQPEGGLDLDATLENLGIDDDPPLTPEERQATVRMLLEARSGVYHGYVAGTPGMRRNWPARGSHAPGTFWFYNNWDFNALGTIFETRFHTTIARAFATRIAGPLGMEDFREEDMHYLRSRSDAAPDFDRSVHPAYHFRLSARDLARLGLLYLRHGEWRGRSIIPSEWVAQSTQAHSATRPGEGYGYLWWVDGFELPERSFSAQGALAKYLVVVPERDLVVVVLNYQEFPDDARGMTEADMKAIPTITHSQMGQILDLLLRAQRSPAKAAPAHAP